jgi:hypothetical protein
MPKPKSCQDPCANDCPTCRPATPDPCNMDCYDRVQARMVATRQARANFRRMQEQLAAGLRETVPRYARRPKPTAGRGHGCGSPPRRILAPLWMYGLGTQRPPHPPVHREITHRRTGHHRPNRPRPFNHADEAGTHRIYLPH